jgi:hypothetical protein
VQVKYRLPAIGVGVNDDAIAGIREAEPSSDVGRGGQQMPKHSGVSLGRLVQRIDMLSRDYQDMRRSLRTQVVERDAAVVLKNQSRRQASVGDLAKDTVFLGHLSVLLIKSQPGVLANLGRCFAGVEAAFDTLDICAERTKLSHDRLVTAIDMINTVDSRLALGAQGR